MADTKRKTRCQCGEVEMELVGPPLASLHCHCAVCQNWSGAPYQWMVLYPADRARFAKGKDNISITKTSDNLDRGRRVPRTFITIGKAACTPFRVSPFRAFVPRTGSSWRALHRRRRSSTPKGSGIRTQGSEPSTHFRRYKMPRRELLPCCLVFRGERRQVRNPPCAFLVLLSLCTGHKKLIRVAPLRVCLNFVRFLPLQRCRKHVNWSLRASGALD